MNSHAPQDRSADRDVLPDGHDQAPFVSVESFRVSLDTTCPSTEAHREEAVPFDGADSPIVQRYRMVELIGRGGFGEVWKAYDNERGEFVAIKGPRIDRAMTPGLVRLFLKEAEKAMHLASASVVPVLDVVQAPTRQEGTRICFIVMKLMAGGSLAKRLYDGERPPLEQAVSWVSALADALEQIHAHGYVHRDIKPANILFDGEDRPYFSDFGLAVSADEQLDEARRVMGTVNYMAPEQARRQHADRRADIFSLGVVLYQLLALPHVVDPRLSLPYLANSADEYLESLQDPNEHARALPQQVPRRLAEIVERNCLRDDKTQRYRSASDLNHDLRAWLKTGRQRRRRFVFGLGALLALAAGGTAAYVSIPPTNPPDAEDQRDLLRQEPRALVFDHRRSFNNLQWEPSTQWLNLRSSNVAMISCGPWDSRGRTLKALIKSQPKPSHFGVFWGFHESPSLDEERVFRAKALMIHCGDQIFDDEVTLINLELVRGGDTGLRIRDASREDSLPLDDLPPQSEWRIEIAFEGGEASELTINNRKFKFTDAPPADAGAFSDGEVGILVYSADFVVKRLFWEPQPR